MSGGLILIKQGSRFACTGLAMLISIPVLGADKEPLAEPLAMGHVLQVVAGLFVVLVIIGIAAWVLRQFSQFPAGGGQLFQVLGGISLGTRERIVLIQVGDVQMIVGVAPGRLVNLHVLAEPMKFEAEGREPSGFLARFNDARRRMQSTSAGTGS